ncbi:MAG TPA: DUF1329 domain-containing protein, partial [Candidatus Kryptonia bacterium]|nr:DUF1329 domain-containing protein [Candidatus Kryptonia bacterium]
MKSHVRVILAVVVATSLKTAFSAGAEIAPHTVIGKATADRATDLVSPGILWCLRHGLEMEIVPYRKIEWNRAYREATDKFAGQVQLAADGRSLTGYVAGLPFPNPDS